MRRIFNIMSLGLLAFVLCESCEKEPAIPEVVNVASVSVSPTSLSMLEGEVKSLSVAVSPDNATNKNVIWSSSDASVASVDKGTVTAIKAGSATISAKSVDGGKTASCSVTVEAKYVPVSSISLDLSSAEIHVGESIMLTATVAPADATNAKVSWTSSDPSVAAVENGKVSALSTGTAEITVTTDDGGKTASCKVSILEAVPYLCLETESGANHLKIENLNANLEYSLGDGVWHRYNDDDVIAFGDGVKVFLRGQGNNTGKGSIGHFVFQDDARVLCSGNIMTLLQYDEIPTSIDRNDCFVSLFDQCYYLVTAPELPATKLSAGCYAAMFNCCFSLVEPPVLPATEMLIGCYNCMFKNCESLIKAPELPATKLAPSCYQLMFNSCLSLSEAPVLPATELSIGCYSGMFENCPIATAPELPATVMAQSCYSQMFFSCSNLKEAPALPAIVLAVSCYTEMFRGCKLLGKAPELPALQLADTCYEGMFESCSALKEAPALPATQLATGCYSWMFFNCTSLTKAPDLPAEKLCLFCYSNMFCRCTSLNYVKALFTDLGDEPGLSFFLDGVASEGTFVKSKDATWDNYGIVPDGWTVEIAE